MENSELKIVYVYFAEHNRTYMMQTLRNLQVFDSVDVVGTDGGTYAGIVVDGDMAMNVCPKLSKRII